MPTTTNITTTYNGEKAAGYLGAALLQNKTIADGLITVKPNIKYKEILKRFSADDMVKDGSCDFDPTSTINLTERELEPKSLQINLSLCKVDFRSDWDAIEMGFSAHDELPKSFADFIIARAAAKAAQRNELSIWQGDGTVNGQFDGFEKLLSLDAELPAANEVTGIAVTTANVTVEMQKVIDAIPSAVYGREGLKLFVAKNVAKAYIASLAGFQSGGVGANGVDNKGQLWYSQGQNLFFNGVEVVMAEGMSDNVMICAESDNLVFGTGLLSDHNEVKLIDTSEILGDQNVRLVMRFTAGVQYAFASDIVTYGIVNAVNPA